ncbi:hypothetical protein L6R52_33320 [Myxococcota bacterium]|nr:hypothetical protein [Myxococcota bacterium]
MKMDTGSSDSSKVTRTKNLTVLLLLGASIAGCTRDVVMSELTVTKLGAAGGPAVSADGLVRLVFAPGALSADTEISITTERSPLARPMVASAIYTFGPEGSTFAAPVRLTMPARGVERPMIAQLTPTQLLIAGDSAVDVTGSEVSTTLAHFSSYAVVATWDSCAGSVCGAACTICEPGDGACVEPPGTFACSAAGACVAASTVTCAPPPDAGEPDAAEPAIDAGEPDATEPAIDAGAPDATEPAIDAGAPDATEPAIDAGEPDATEPAIDAGAADAGAADAGAVDAGGVTFPLRLAELEPNGTATVAQPLTLPVGGSIYVDAVLTQPSDHDLFRVTVPAGSVGRLSAQTAATAITGGATTCTTRPDTWLELSDAQQQLLASNDDFGAGNFCSRVEWDVVAGDYYVLVRHFSRTHPVDEPYVLILELP